MSIVMQVEAYRSFYKQGMEAYNEGNMENARSLLLRSAEMANAISDQSRNYEVKVEYRRIAIKILEFVKVKCIKTEVQNSKDAIKNDEQKDDLPNFEETVNSEDDKITFADVAGLNDVKEEIEFKVINPSLNPELARKYKINAGGKILLYGPPGTGKTFIARAIAGEVDAKFYAVNCQDLISKYMGDSSKLLDKLFNTALKNERAIIFFDEFDSVASKRESDSGGVDAEMARFVATFLTKVDGFKKSKTNKMLLLIAATNRPWALDSAMIRGGRFDTHIYVGLPDADARKFLLEKNFSDVPVADDFDVDYLVDRLSGFGCGDIVAIAEKIRLEAYKEAVRTGEEIKITTTNCNNVIDKQRNVISSDELLKFERFKNGEEID